MAVQYDDVGEATNAMFKIAEILERMQPTARMVVVAGLLAEACVDAAEQGGERGEDDKSRAARMLSGVAFGMVYDQIAALTE